MTTPPGLSGGTSLQVNVVIVQPRDPSALAGVRNLSDDPLDLSLPKIPSVNLYIKNQVPFPGLIPTETKPLPIGSNSTEIGEFL